MAVEDGVRDLQPRGQAVADPVEGGDAGGGERVPVGASVGIYWAHRAAIDLPVLSGPRVVAVIVLVLGVSACAVGGGIAPAQVPQPRAPWLRVLGLHGAAAFFITVVAVITGSWGVVAALVALLVLMWLAALLTMSASLAVYASGFVQFGVRYYVQVFPFLLVLLAWGVGKGKRLDQLTRILILASILIVSYGIWHIRTIGFG